MVVGAISKRGQSRGRGAKTLELPPSFFEKKDVGFALLNDVELPATVVDTANNTIQQLIIESMATATRNVNAVDIDGPDDLDKFVQDLMSNMASERHFFCFVKYMFGVLPFTLLTPLLTRTSL